MNKKLILSLIIIIFVGGIIALIIKGNTEKSSVTILNNKEEVDYFVLQFKDKSIKFQNNNDVDLMCEILDGKAKRNKSADDKKGWIYKIAFMDSNDNQLEEIYIINDTTIKINDKAYSCKKINISKIDELTKNRE